MDIHQNARLTPFSRAALAQTGPLSSLEDALSNVAWAGFLRLLTLTFGRPTWVVTRTPAQAELGRCTLGS